MKLEMNKRSKILLGVVVLIGAAAAAWFLFLDDFLNAPSKPAAVATAPKPALATAPKPAAAPAKPAAEPAKPAADAAKPAAEPMKTAAEPPKPVPVETAAPKAPEPVAKPV